MACLWGSMTSEDKADFSEFFDVALLEGFYISVEGFLNAAD